MEVSVRNSSIEKLNSREQWESWKFCIELALIGADAYDVVTGAELLTPETFVQWKKKDNAGRVIIGHNLGPKFINHVKHCKTSKAMWDVLFGICEKKDKAGKARVQALFWNFKVEATEDIVDVISRMNDIVTQLSDHGDVKSDEEQVNRLIGALPAEYRSFCCAWESTPEKQKTFAHLCERLISEEERWGLGHSMQDTAKQI